MFLGLLDTEETASGSARIYCFWLDNFLGYEDIERSVYFYSFRTTTILWFLVLQPNLKMADIIQTEEDIELAVRLGKWMTESLVAKMTTHLQVR